MAHDILRGKTPGDWSLPSAACGSLPAGATGYAPTSWWSASQAEAKVQELMKSGGLFGTRLPRELAERKTLELMRKNSVGIMSGTMGSWLLSAKEQKAIFDKIDDVRFDLRAVSRRVGIGLGCLAGALGVLGVASIYRTSTSSQAPGAKAKGYGQIARY